MDNFKLAEKNSRFKHALERRNFWLGILRSAGKMSDKKLKEIIKHLSVWEDYLDEVFEVSH